MHFTFKHIMRREKCVFFLHDDEVLTQIYTVGLNFLLFSELFIYSGKYMYIEIMTNTFYTVIFFCRG